MNVIYCQGDHINNKIIYMKISENFHQHWLALSKINFIMKTCIIKFDSIFSGWKFYLFGKLRPKAELTSIYTSNQQLTVVYNLYLLLQTHTFHTHR